MTSEAIITECRAFAAEFPTPNVERAVALAENGTLAWADVHEVLRRSLGVALATVEQPAA